MSFLHRSSHRFLWYQDPINTDIYSVNELPKLAVFRMRRVTFGVTTSPFLLAAVIRKHLLSQITHKKLSQRMLQSFYVDDLVLSTNNAEEAFKSYQNSIEIMEQANMNLRKWSSNDAKLIQRFIKDKTNSKSEKCKKVLGINWYTMTDQISVNLKPVSNDTQNKPTKRVVLQSLAKVFDPLGILGPFTVKMKILMQKIWKLNLKWDEVIPDEFQKEWLLWIQDIESLTDFVVPRCIIQNDLDLTELHIFADASPQAFGVVAYLKCLRTNKSILFMSKNRVSPLKHEITIPILELTAAVCASRFQKYIIESVKIKINEVFLWSDSKITLYWIKNKKMKWKPFVQNRVQEINSIKNVTWKFCPGKENPADLLTRGVTSAKLLKESKIWNNGPAWLSGSQSEWPSDKDEEEFENNMVYLIEHAKENPKVVPILNTEKYSSYEKVLRITSWVYRFGINTDKKQNKITGLLTSNEMKKSEVYWLKITQRESYCEEIDRLTKNQEINRTSSILKLNPFLDQNGLLRLGGRLQESNLSYDEKHPVILPKKSYITKRIIWQVHEESMHGGVNIILTLIRQKYWVIQARQQIKKIINKCIKCRKLKGKSGMEPFAPLPRDRVTMGCPFQVTGIDFAGPLYVSTENSDRKKVYIMLFTCAVIRAVHLELVESLSTESCIMGLRRFISRRGVPSTVYSDNAKTFRRSATELDELSKILESNTVQDLARNKRIQWKFIVERGSWWGGFWERLVRSIKNCLKITLGRKVLDFYKLQTILTEVEATVNSRPLTYVDEDPTNLFILTPAKFLMADVDLGFSPNLKTKDMSKNEILKIWKGRGLIMEKFWKIWQKEYLQQLRSAHYIHSPR